MSRLKLIDNQDVNWSTKAFYYDENGQAHAQHLHWGDDYTLEDGSTIDDVDALCEGVYISGFDYEEYEQEWN